MIHQRNGRVLPILFFIPLPLSIVVSQWIGLLDIARFQLDSAGISWTSIDSR